MVTVVEHLKLLPRPFAAMTDLLRVSGARRTL